MKYMLLFTGSDEGLAAMTEQERERVFGDIGRWWDLHSSAGRIIGGEQLQPSHTATTVRFDGDRPVVTDGPYIEAKERIGGYALIDVGDLDEALSLAKTWPARGAVEVRPIVHADGDSG
jgi:hypothetical protein